MKFTVSGIQSRITRHAKSQEAQTVMRRIIKALKLTHTLEGAEKLGWLF